MRQNPGVGIDVHHHAADIAHRSGDGRRIVALAEREHAAHPLVLLERDRARGADDDVRTESPDLLARSAKLADFANGPGGDHGDRRFVEDSVLHLHHLYGSLVAPSDLRGEGLPEQGQVFALRRADVGQLAVLTQRRETDEVGERARRQPGHPAAIVQSTECEPPVAVDAVPAERGGIEGLAAHGFHGIAEDRFDLAYLNGHFVLRRHTRSS